MDHRLSITGTYNTLEELIRELQSAVRDTPPQRSVVYQLPKYTKTDELTFSPSVDIPVFAVEDPVLVGTTALGYHTIDGDESGLLLRRWPGIFVYDDDRPDIKRLIEAINTYKDMFKKLVDDFAQSLPGDINNPKKQKFDFVHNLLPMTATLYVYRKIHCVNGPLKAAYWSFLTAPDQKSFNKSQLIRHIKSSINDLIEFGIDYEDKIGGLSGLLRTVEASSHDDYVYRVKKPPRPNLCVHFANGAKPSSIYGALPVFVFNQNTEYFRITKLKTYSASLKENTRKVRADAVKLHHLYGDYYYR